MTEYDAFDEQYEHEQEAYMERQETADDKFGRRTLTNCQFCYTISMASPDILKKHGWVLDGEYNEWGDRGNFCPSCAKGTNENKRLDERPAKAEATV